MTKKSTKKQAAKSAKSTSKTAKTQKIVAKTAAAPKAAAQKPAAKKRFTLGHKPDYAKMTSPYREGTAKRLVFDLIASGKVKKADLKEKALTELKKAKLTGNMSITMLIYRAIADAVPRGFKVSVDGDSYKVTRLSVKTAR